MNFSRAKQVLTATWQALGPRVSSILGSEAELDAVEVVTSLDIPEHAFIARLVSTSSNDIVAHAIFTRSAAIAISGTLMMMQEGTITERLAAGVLEPDDVDTMGDFMKQLSAALNEQLAANIERQVELVFDPGEVDRAALLAEGDVVIARGELRLGTYEGCNPLQLVFPGRLFTTSSDATEIVPPAERAANSEAMSPSGGLELTSEEMEAIRDATRAMAGAERTLVLVPVGRERPVWEGFLESAGVEFEFVEDVWMLRRALESGTCRAIVVDADAMPAGGLTALSALRSFESGSLPIVVVASSPTRSHLLRCIAAGAQAYLRKPLEPERFMQTLQQLEPIAVGGT